MYQKDKIKPVRPVSRPTAFQQFKAEIGDSILSKDAIKILQQKYGISEAEVLESEKNLTEKEEVKFDPRRRFQRR